MEINQIEARSIELSMEYVGRQDWEQWFLFTADHHFDSTHCDRELLEKHFKQAKERDAKVFVFGDLFDVMQGKNDRRGSKGDLREEYRGGNYYDLVVSDAAKFYGKYSDQLCLLTYGNHETAITKHQETDVLQRLADLINFTNNSSVAVGAYSGWVTLRFHVDSSRVRRFRLFYHHGSGGGGPVTKGVIQTNRRSTFIPDADFIVTGHIHEAWHLETVQERLNNVNVPYLSAQHHIQLPTYKEEYLDGMGWHTQRGAPPKPLGGYWLRFYFSTRDDVTFEVIRAQ